MQYIMLRKLMQHIFFTFHIALPMYVQWLVVVSTSASSKLEMFWKKSSATSSSSSVLFPHAHWLRDWEENSKLECWSVCFLSFVHSLSLLAHLRFGVSGCEFDISQFRDRKTHFFSLPVSKRIAFGRSSFERGHFWKYSEKQSNCADKVI